MFDIESILATNLNILKSESDVSSKNKFSKWPKNRMPSRYEEKSVNEWSQRDFAFYMEKEYIAILGEVWEFNLLGVTTYLSRIKAKIKDFYGFCDNVLLKDYIDYFYKEWIFYCKTRHIKFWLKFMLDNKPLSAFCSAYSYSTQEVKDNKDEAGILSEKDLDNFYALSVEALVFNYGLIVSIDYLLNNKKMDEKSVYDKIYHIICSSLKDGNMSKLKEKTKKYRLSDDIYNNILQKLKNNYDISI